MIESKICQEVIAEPDYLDSLVPEDLRLMFHKLCQHQFELESKNEELQRSLAELEAARMRYYNLYDLAPVGYCTLNANKLIVEVNRTAANLLGGVRDTLIDRPFSQFVHAEDRNIQHQFHRNVLLHQRPQSCELRLVGEEGPGVWVQLTSFVLETASKQEYRVVMTDISDHKRVDETLRQKERNAQESKNLLKLVLDTIPVRLFWKDLNSIYLGCNAQFARTAGYEIPEELIGLDDFSMSWKEQAEMNRLDDFEVMNSGKPKLNFEDMQATPEGKQVWLSTSKVPLRDADGKVIGILGASEVITERKSMEEDLLKARQFEFLGALSGGIVHDFNNMLMVVAGNVSLAKTLLSPSDMAFKHLDKAEASALKAKYLTRQLLAFAHDSSLVKRPVSATELMKTCCRLTLSGTKSMCSYGMPEDLWDINADEGKLCQALATILMTIHRNMKGDGAINIRGENVVVSEEGPIPLKSGHYVKLEISGQGQEMLEKRFERAGEPVMATSTANFEQSLVAAHCIIQQHEGFLAVESTGKGAVCTLFLPVTPESLATDALSPVTDISEPVEEIQETGKILIMDDDELVCNILGAMLEKLGFEADFSHDGEQALEKYVEAQQSGTPFKAVIMDLIIPFGMGGREAMEKLRTIDPQARVIVSSGYLNNSIMDEYQEHGFRDIMAKPYRFSDLRKTLRRVLRNGSKG